MGPNEQNQHFAEFRQKVDDLVHPKLFAKFVCQTRTFCNKKRGKKRPAKLGSDRPAKLRGAHCVTSLRQTCYVIDNTKRHVIGPLSEH